MTTLYLVGDAGDVEPGDTLMARLAEDVRASDRAGGAVIVAFLGDNVYEEGVRRQEPSYSADTLTLGAQLAVIQGTGAQALFVLGNHDWDSGGDDGLAAVDRQHAYFEARAAAGARVSMLPAAGCPGPEVVELPELRIVALDTQWFLHGGDKRSGPPCSIARAEDVAPLITRALRDAPGETVVLAHHPLVTYGEHGGRFPLNRHLFPLLDVASWAYLPLPIFGTAYVVARQQGVTGQDLSGGANVAMRRVIEDGMAGAERRPLAYAAGHEHGLQVIEGGDDPRAKSAGSGEPAGEHGGDGDRPSGAAAYHLVSGSVGRPSGIKAGPGSMFWSSRPGYMRVELTATQARITVFPLGDEEGAAGATRDERAGWCRVVDRATREAQSCSVGG